MRFGEIDQDYAIRLATCPPEEDGPVLMVNLMRYRAQAEYRGEAPLDADGNVISGREADDRYAPLGPLAAVGATVVLHADVIDTASSGGGEDWHRVGIVRYPTRRSFIDMQSRKDFQEKYPHKEAGMERTVIVGVPVPGPHSVSGSSDADVTAPTWLVVRPVAADTPAELAVEGTIVGDGRRWASVEFGSGADAPTADDGSMVIAMHRLIDRMDLALAPWERG
jgi:hypothetical protein